MFRNLTASEQRTLVTRLLMSIFALVTALAVTDRSSFAQSAYSYPWCLERGIGGPRSCYYSYEQCRYEAFTRGGFLHAEPVLSRKPRSACGYRSVTPSTPPPAFLNHATVFARKRQQTR
jgi:hypothetical protein